MMSFNFAELFGSKGVGGRIGYGRQCATACEATKFPSVKGTAAWHFDDWTQERANNG
jgi:hypothetical protein